MRYFLFLFFFHTLHAEILETPRFRDLLQHVQPGDLLLLDIDDTLLIPRQMLGCDEWFQHRLKERRNAGVPLEVALEKTLFEWEAIRHVSHMDLVEADTHQLIQELQDKGCTVMGLTTQRFSIANCTIRQLLHHQIDLRKTAPIAHDCYFSVGGHGILFRHGILFTSGTAKGEALFYLLDQAGYSPSRILFINDKGSHLGDVESTAVHRQVPFLGFRYSYCDERKRAFRPEIAQLQFDSSTFSSLVSDEEAANQLAE